uniref:Zinc finger CCCH domain-containing protein 15 (Trinotate prediction) n=1 Tax=Henneguya salminicola TaxID=69463 RepID=A0A6G3MGB2_HENSL
MNQDELEAIILKRHSQKNMNKSETICKYFLEAVEKKLYGWFWICPNGGDNCHYRHALPNGYVLKRDTVTSLHVQEIPIEEIIENERAHMEGELIPVTEETFKAWKEQQLKYRREKLESDMNKKREEMVNGKFVSRITGKEAFSLDPSLIKQDDDEAEDINEHEESEHISTYEEILAKKLAEVKIVDTALTVAISLNPKNRIMGEPTQ